MTDRLPEGLTPRIKHARDGFHRTTGIRRFGSGVALMPEGCFDKLLLVESVLIDVDGKKHSRLELPGGGVGFIDAMKERVTTDPTDRFEVNAHNITAFMNNALEELGEEALLSRHSVELVGYNESEANGDGPDNYGIFYATAPESTILHAIERVRHSGERSKEIVNAGLYTYGSARDYILHHAADVAFRSLEQIPELLNQAA